MLIDKQLSFFDRTDLTGSAAGDDTLDMGVKSWLGVGEEKWFVVHLEKADAANGDETYAFQLRESATETGVGTLIPNMTITVDRDRDDTPMYLALPPGREYERYLKCSAVLGGTTPSCTVTAGISTMRPEVAPFYNDAISFSANA